MKKLSFALIAALLLGSINLKADEGMWMLPLLEKFNIKKMHEKGLKLSAEDIYSINHSSIKDAIVHFGGGCTAEIVSNKGLLFTNHHFGYGAIKKLITVDHDYLYHGFCALTLNQEPPADAFPVTLIAHFTDITAQL